MTSSGPAPTARNRIQIFVDFWNLQLTMNEKVGYGFRFDWEHLPDFLMREAARVGSLSGVSYEGTRVYASYDRKAGRRRRVQELTARLAGPASRRAGLAARAALQGSAAMRQLPQADRRLPGLRQGSVGIEEKGVDAAIVTDMVRLAWEDHFDVAVLVSSDSASSPRSTSSTSGGKR